MLVIVPASRSEGKTEHSESTFQASISPEHGVSAKIPSEKCQKQLRAVIFACS